MAVTSPKLFIFKLVKYPETLVCESRWCEAFARSLSVADYVLALYVVFYYVPVVLLIVLYSIILFKLKSQKIPREQPDRTELQRARRNRNVLKISTAFVLGFGLCWLPFSVINLLAFFLWDRTLSCGMELYTDISRLFYVSGKLCNKPMYLLHFQ